MGVWSFFRGLLTRDPPPGDELLRDSTPPPPPPAPAEAAPKDPDVVAELKRLTPAAAARRAMDALDRSTSSAMAVSIARWLRENALHPDVPPRDRVSLAEFFLRRGEPEMAEALLTSVVHGPPEVAAPAYVPRARQPSGKRGRWQEPDPFLKDRPNATVASTPLIAERMHTRALLAAFLNHPFLFDHWHEALADIEFADAGLDSLRREIVNVTATRPGLDADALQSHLAESEHAFMLSHVMQKDVAGTFPFTRREAFPQDVRAKVAEIFGRLMDRRVAEDRRLLMAVTLSEETAEAWARYKALFADRARAHGGDEEEGGPMDAVAPS